MNTIQIDPVYILLAGLFANLATAAIKREHWSANASKIASLVLSAVSGFVAVLAQQKGLNAQTLGYTLAGTLGVNQAAYALLLKGTPLGTILNNVFNPAANPTDANTTLAAEVASTVVTVPAPHPGAIMPAPAAPAVEPSLAQQ